MGVFMTGRLPCDTAAGMAGLVPMAAGRLTLLQAAAAQIPDDACDQYDQDDKDKKTVPSHRRFSRGRIDARFVF
ncbi:hypothetical protein N8D56_22295 [Devosia sp. A8/3-2]|nr:hypothetical protein N8D56_22295 [Devosia sp. A8/3-2]